MPRGSPDGDTNDRVALGIAQRLEVPDMVGRLLATRGVGVEAAVNFLEPTLRALLPDPSCLIDMDAAAERLADAVMAAETVGVFGDYDVDGACSAALMVTWLRSLGCVTLHHVPDRMKEGYGPNAPALLGLVERGARLIVCVDCGTAASDALSVLTGRADAVILDHHKADGPPPAILATVNPNRLDDTSGLTTLCAAGVSFLTVVAATRTLRRRGFFARRTEPDLMGLLDLVALATVCDVMPLSGVNRALVFQGLRIMARRARPGVAALLEVTQARDKLSAFTCGFALGPRINAAGRINEADLGLRLLLCEDRIEALALAERLDGINRQRQDVEAEMLEAAMHAASLQAAAGDAVLVVAGEGWHPGVVGIVSGRIKERFNRPACVAGIAAGMAKGSGRSVPGIDLGGAVIAARQSGILATGGGHPMAAGFSCAADRVEDFRIFLNERLAAAAGLPSAVDLLVEGALSVPGATIDLARQVERLAPFGAGNEEPVLVLQRARVIRADRVGKDQASIRVFLEGEGGGPRLKGMLFRARDGALADALLSRDRVPLHLAGYLRVEAWNGAENPGFIISDAAVA
ncbi:MAG: single-stranded-DNA-specific exonuclease RecJ [Acetobacteraceae bacterium]|nr:single-stranded-DNA-specific exonuclease RecJ [Acetobacteraceae bacterium]